MFWFFVELVLDLWPQLMPSASVVALQVRNLALLHGFAWPRAGDQAGHAVDAIDVVPPAGGGLGGGLA